MHLLKFLSVFCLVDQKHLNKAFTKLAWPIRVRVSEHLSNERYASFCLVRKIKALSITFRSYTQNEIKLVIQHNFSKYRGYFRIGLLLIV